MINKKCSSIYMKITVVNAFIKKTDDQSRYGCHMPLNRSANYNIILYYIIIILLILLLLYIIKYNMVLFI